MKTTTKNLVAGGIVAFSFFMSELALSAEAVLSKPLIIGASVSAGYQGVVSPGDRLALRHTTKDQIRKSAINGRSGRDTMRTVTDNLLKDRSLIIGVDLFFWDAVRSHPLESLAAIKELVKKAKAHDAPVIVGDIPGLYPPMQPHFRRLNQELEQACATYDKCRILPMNEIYQNAMAAGYIEYRGRRYPPHELIPDGLHLSPIASEFLADQLDEILKKAGYFR